jgi:alanyl-tRNA synthetase
MTVKELREKYLAFFQSKGHQLYPSGSLIPYDVTGRLDESLLFNGAGMVQFKPFFRGVATPPSKRLTNCQKCVRTGDIDEVGDPTHLTFFEMLGNFSFGDYFKKEAIGFSWEFLTSPQWLNLDPKFLVVTVFTEDDEAYDAWSKHFEAVGLNSEHRIFRLDEETNYWPAGAFSSGPPGPCGPNSEMFYWTPKDEAPPTGVYTAEDFIRDEDKWLEVWNDVFIQYEWQGVLRDSSRPDKGYEKTGMPELPFRSVDTGMGLERTATALGGYRSIYDTDAFQPILSAIAARGEGLRYNSGDEGKDNAMRVIGDHLRTASFCIADGVLPSNGGRGYVLRRLIRRAVLKGQRVLGFSEPFMADLVDAVVATFHGHYAELLDRQDLIRETLRNEESQFRRTLAEGVQVLQSILDSNKGDQLPGERAFFLYDTYGFPLEVTQELCTEAGLDVDLEGFRTAMAEAQERSRGASGMDTVYGSVEGEVQAPATEFLGYNDTRAEGTILDAQPAKDDDLIVVLDRSPFYAESGGQVGDTGVLEVGESHLLVTDVQKQNGVFLHRVSPGHDLTPDQLKGKTAKALVDDERRKEITRHHTATHLLHAALKQVLGPHVNQAGSLVSPDILRFDFTHGSAMTPAEIADVERIVNEQIWAAQPIVILADTPIAEARAMGAMALFGEKYGDRVRVVQVGDVPPGSPSFSRELCGGIHVRNTGEIGLFKIVHEASAASGVRRITALAGRRAYDHVRDVESTIHEAAEKLKSTPKQLLEAIDKTLENLREEKRKREKLAAQGGSQAAIEAVGGFEFAVEKLEGADPKDAQLVCDRLVDGHPLRVALVANVADGKVTFACKVGKDAVAKGAHAGNLVKAAATAAGGGGGGRPDFATAGARDPQKLDAAVEAARRLLLLAG